MTNSAVLTEGPSRFKLTVFWLGLFLLVGLLALGVVEVFLRVALKHTLTAETGFPLVASDVPGLGYQLAPNSNKAGVETDSNGFRLRAAVNSTSQLNVIVLGDSISFGSGVQYPQSYVPQLERRLNEAMGEPVSVWNTAVPGYNTSQEAAMLNKALPLLHPDLIIVQFCMNDYLDPPRLTPGGNLDQTSSADGSGFSPLAFLYNSRALVFFKEKFKDVQRARPEWFPVWAHYIHRIQTKPGWQRAKEALLQIQQSALRSHAKLLVIIFPVEQQLRIGDRAAQDDLLQFAREHGIDAFDLYDSFQAHWRESLYVDYWEQVKQFDKLHPNVRGHALAAQEIAGAVLSRRAQLPVRSATASAVR